MRPDTPMYFFLVKKSKNEAGQMVEAKPLEAFKLITKDNFKEK